jgi:hypothetical protein
MAARGQQSHRLEADPHNFLLMHAMGPNVAGVIGSAVAAGVMITLVGAGPGACRGRRDMEARFSVHSPPAAWSQSCEAMNPNYLDFEQPIAELEVKIEELQHVGSGAELNLSRRSTNCAPRARKLTEKIFSNLSPGTWSRGAAPAAPLHPRLHPAVFEEFDELHGDRRFGDDKAIVGGLARLDGRP